MLRPVYSFWSVWQGAPAFQSRSNGTVDTTYVLEKDKRSDNVAKVYITGRDVEYMELTLQFENCIWECISCETAEDVRKHETPEFIFRVVTFMAGCGEWHGSATDLLIDMKDATTAANTVTKLLNQHYEVLAEGGIEYRYNHTGKSRLIRLRSDGYDSCDTEIPVGKQPSQPSSTVTYGDGQPRRAHDFACKV